MFNTFRLAAAILIVALYTLPLLVVQEVALRTRVMSDRRIPRLWHQLTLRVLGVRVRVKGTAVRERPLMIAANHVSWLDILVLGSLDGVHFIAKAEMRHWPVLGTFARQQRSVFVERDRRRASPEQAREIAERLADGDPMVLFAEGTTGDGNRLLPFNSTLFSAAQLALAGNRAGCVTVQPAAIAYTHKGGLRLGRRERAEIAWIGDMDLVPHLRTVLAARPVDVVVQYGEPIPFPAKGDRKAVARAAEAQVRAMLVATLRDDKS
ncbi:1-acyl-sn-glycerol-3-phosphate acyltransferase [Nitratireductor sp. ZSWI3]|uniref:lysophospholipid acyltransferase family protein n=1 Tax=Nitratireductor sp. ZSWI3 TaxID=2966359 RepID=UPI0021505B48|nr:lysophospholipid acyltransferase family protein [Nitratireductor sp. ZSWI3]MCR4268742.1 1-acyl-sn-glycerol-3-phosphate acyltransferase [Nitratireductor sp. ZSWI3]